MCWQMHFNEIGVNRGNLATYRILCLKRQFFCMISEYSAIEIKELSFWSINYVSRIKTMFLWYKICFKDKISKNVSIICTVLV